MYAKFRVSPVENILVCMISGGCMFGIIFGWDFVIIGGIVGIIMGGWISFNDHIEERLCLD